LKAQQKILWVEVRKETGRGGTKSETLTDARCSQLVMDFLSTTDVRRLIPVAAEDDARSEVSEWDSQS
jgi:hypothetical protein